MAGRALIIIDVQKCFLPGGSFSRPTGDCGSLTASKILLRLSLLRDSDKASNEIARNGAKTAELKNINEEVKTATATPAPSFISFPAGHKAQALVSASAHGHGSARRLYQSALQALFPQTD